jgi:hypothetical protein
MEWTTRCYDTYNNPTLCDNTRGPFCLDQPVRCTITVTLVVTERRPNA